MTKVKGFDNVKEFEYGEQQHIYIDDEHIGWLIRPTNNKGWKPIYCPQPPDMTGQKHITPLQVERTKKEAIQALIDRHGQ